jgi:hypothetical protein
MHYACWQRTSEWQKITVAKLRARQERVVIGQIDSGLL